MSRPHGRARVNTRSPVAFAKCDRTGRWVNRTDLYKQYYYAGTKLVWSGLLVCKDALDIPNDQLRTIILPPDPVGVINARTEPFSYDEAGPVQSLIVQNAAQGAVLIYLTSVSGFVVTNNVLVQLDNGSFAEVVVTSVDPIANTIGISIPLPYAASINGVVTVTVT